MFSTPSIPTSSIERHWFGPTFPPARASTRACARVSEPEMRSSAHSLGRRSGRVVRALGVSCVWIFAGLGGAGAATANKEPRADSLSNPWFAGRPAVPAVISIDQGRQLLVDDFLVEQTTLRRAFH